MNTYKRHRFPPDIISYAVWLYYRFKLSHRDVEDLLAERGITVSRELMPDVIHDNSQYANNRAEQSHEATRVRERVM
jgi:transposase-like protein